MSLSDRSAQAEKEQLVLRLARERLAARPAWQIQECAGVRFLPGAPDSGIFEVPFLGGLYHVTHPDGQVTQLDINRPPRYTTAVLLMHYLGCADGYPMADRYISFRELPGGLMYDRAVRARTEPALLHLFVARRDQLVRAALALGGSRITYGDLAYMFDILPRVRMALVFHAGDEEFPPAVSMLYDGAASHYLPTDDLAVLAGVLVGALSKAAAS